MMKITEAIRNQKKDKAPGPDGIPAEYYKQYQHILADILKELITDIFDGGLIPDS